MLNSELRVMSHDLRILLFVFCHPRECGDPSLVFSLNFVIMLQ